MALRFVRTIDKSPHMFASDAEADNDWLLFCGDWQVGRILRPGGLPAQRQAFSWSLTGPHTPEAPMKESGEAATAVEANEQLVAAMRAWAVGRAADARWRPPCGAAPGADEDPWPAGTAPNAGRVGRGRLHTGR